MIFGKTPDGRPRVCFYYPGTRSVFRWGHIAVNESGFPNFTLIWGGPWRLFFYSAIGRISNRVFRGGIYWLKKDRK